MCTYGTVNILFCVEILMYTVLLIHAYMYISDACDFIFIHQ